jgi:pyruvate formate lyase activating enzyme
VNLRGWVKTSLIDYPGHIATVLFTGGCNFRCPMCHNAELVLRPASLPAVPVQDVWDFLARREGLIDGVVITGGEPTLQDDLLPFVRRMREHGLGVKLDTNGYRPDVLEALLDERLVDFVAMDVKAPLETYALLAGRNRLAWERVARSIDLLRDESVAYEFRTTVVPGLLDADDVADVARQLEGAARYVLQQFRPQGTLDPALEDVTPYPPARLEAMADRARRWVERVEVRGV